MKLENINKLLLEATEKSRNRLLFDFNFGKIILKCLLLTGTRVLMVSGRGQSVGFSTTIDADGNISAFLPPEFYQAIISEIKNVYGTNSPNSMWGDFDGHILKLNIDKISEANDNDIRSIVGTLKTIDRKYDPDGDKPFFVSWVRNKDKNVTHENNEKTARYFGQIIANLCKKENENVSSRWSVTPHDKSLDFLHPKRAENEIRSSGKTFIEHI